VALLSPAEMALLERLTLVARGKLLGSFTGDHRSRRFGSSLDFADYREYRPGDDFRRIDASVSARLDRLFLRLFEAEEDVPVRIIVDASASMGFGSPSKLAMVQRLAAALTHVALLQHDRVRLYAARDRIEPSRWLAGRTAVYEAMTWLGALTPAGRGGLPGAVRAIRSEGRPGVTAVLADLLEPAWEDALARLGPPGEAFVVHVLAPDELEPRLEGDLTLVDAESGDEVPISIDAGTLRRYRARVSAWRDEVRSACTSRAIGYAFARADDHVLDVVLARLTDQRVVR
jgi:uncharacterized protein (DUF58 family)